MSNIFKTNSRFSVLAKEVSTFKEIKKNKNNRKNEDGIKLEDNVSIVEVKTLKNDNNIFKKTSNDRPYMKYNNGYQRYSLTNKEDNDFIEMRALREKLIKEDEEKKEVERVAKALCIDNFPNLGKTETKTETVNVTNNNSFLEKFKNSIENDNPQNEIKNKDNSKVKPGWVSIRRDKQTGITTTEYGKPTLYKETEKETEKEIVYEVIYALCNLHERRTNDYIELYDYDNWEKTFKSLNWREEEEYEAQMEEEYETDTEEYIIENDRYWERY